MPPGFAAARSLPLKIGSVEPFCDAPAGTASECADGTDGTETKISWIEPFVNDLLEPVGRATRAKVAQDLQSGHLFRGARPLAPRSRLTHRRGWVLEAVTKILEIHREPMRASAIHAAVEELVGEPVCWSSVKNCLSEGTRKSGRFERLGYGRYRLMCAEDA